MNFTSRIWHTVLEFAWREWENIRKSCQDYWPHNILLSCSFYECDPVLYAEICLCYSCPLCIQLNTRLWSDSWCPLHLPSCHVWSVSHWNSCLYFLLYADLPITKVLQQFHLSAYLRQDGNSYISCFCKEIRVMDSSQNIVFFF